MHFQIIPTTLCNARCFYCYECESISETMRPEIAEATVDFIKKYISANPCSGHSIDWFGGEPMLVPELIMYMASEILRYSEEHSININSEIVTNASKINGRSIEFLKKIGINRVHISMDGMGEEYEKRKAFADGENHFNHVIEAVHILTEHDIKVMIRINVDGNNIDSCLKLISYLKDNISNNVEVHVAPLYGYGGGYLTPENVIPVLTDLQLKIDAAGFKRTIRKSINANICRGAQQRNLVIKPNGDIIHCEHMYNEKVAIVGNVYEGIINDTGWICDKCMNFAICKQGCIDEKSINCEDCWKAIWRK